MVKTRWGRPFVILWLSLFAAMIALRTFLPQLLRPDLREDDYAQLVWWMYRFNDAELFPNDVAFDFFSQPIFSTYGWQVLYRVFVPFMDAQQFAEMLPFFLVVPACIFVFLLGNHYGKGLSGAVFAVLVFALIEMRYLRSGLPRSFAIPILLFGMWALSQHRQKALGLSILLGALFYPPCAANLSLLAAVVLAFRWQQDKRLPPNWPTFLVFVCGAGIVLAVAYVHPLPDGIGPRTSFETAWSMPEFWPGGRSAFFDSDPVHFYVTKSSSGLGLDPYAAVGALLLIALTLRYFPRSVSFEIWSLVGTSLVLFVLAHGTLFLMYFPNRFFRYAWPVFYLLFLTSLFPILIEFLRTRELWHKIRAGGGY